MKSLKLILLRRFTFIVLLHTSVTLLSVYGITLWNMSKTADWQLEEFEQQVLEDIEGELPLKSVKHLLPPGAGEESRYALAIQFNDGKAIHAGRNSDELADNFDEVNQGLSLRCYKEFSIIRRHHNKQFTVLTSINVKLDLIDDTLWIFALTLPFILLPALILSYRTFNQLVRPLKTVSSTLKNIEEGRLGTRVELTHKHFEIDQLMQRLNATLGHLQNLFTQSERFNAHAAHELKTPLSAMKGEIDLCLQKDRSSEEYQDCLTKANEEIYHLNGIVESLLLVSSPGTKWQESFEHLDIKSCIEGSAEILELIALERGIELHWQVDRIQFTGSKQLLQQAFFNLIENALKYSVAGGRVWVTLIKENDGFKFSVEDSAEPLDEQQRLDILQPFYRLSTAVTGTGLGLSIVQWVVKIHHCQLAVAATANGNTFTISSQSSQRSA